MSNQPRLLTPVKEKTDITVKTSPTSTALLSPGSPDNQTIGLSWNEGTQRGSLQKKLQKQEEKELELNDSIGVIKFEDADEATDLNNKTPSKL